jgi:mannose-1-phosphate guanylyltransferase
MRSMEYSRKKQSRAAVVLAGGEGTRLLPLTARFFGEPVPKQFCPLFGAETMLDRTMRRVSLSVSPRCTLTVVTRAHRKFYATRLAGSAANKLVVQPENRGTAAAIFYGIVRLANLSGPDAIAIFPSDHEVDDDQRFMSFIDMAFDVVHSYPRFVVLLGITPTAPEVQYGWIQPGEPIAGWADWQHFRRVRRFYEKPSELSARTMYRNGYLWNSFVIVARTQTLLALCAKAEPKIFNAFATIRPSFGTSFEERAVEVAYRNLEPTNFSETVLTKFPSEMAVLRVSGVQWTDLGTPERLLPVLQNLRRRGPAMTQLG